MPAEAMSGLLSLIIGLGLAAACGFRVFVPLFIAAAAAHWGRLPTAAGFEWLGGLPAVIAFGTATVLEIGAYYIPWVDHALDVVATPAAVLAGMAATASVLTDLPPLVKWAVTIVGGGGIAGLIQGATVLFRLKSTALTGGIGNPVVATVETAGATVTALLAILLPLLCLFLSIALVVVAFRATGRLLFGRHARQGGTP